MSPHSVSSNMYKVEPSALTVQSSSSIECNPLIFRSMKPTEEPGKLSPELSITISSRCNILVKQGRKGMQVNILNVAEQEPPISILFKTTERMVFLLDKDN